MIEIPPVPPTGLGDDFDDEYNNCRLPDSVIVWRQEDPETVTSERWKLSGFGYRTCTRIAGADFIKFMVN